MLKLIKKKDVEVIDTENTQKMRSAPRIFVLNLSFILYPKQQE
jgi:hypothetical protein